MIRVNQRIYQAAQEMIRSGAWEVDASQGVVSSTVTGKPVSARANSSGYLQLRFTFDGKPMSPLTHRVIWESSAGRIADGLFVNHIDGDKLNNRLSNLELVTQSQNSLHAYRLGLKPRQAGDAAPWAKLTNEQAREICARALRGERQDAIAADFGVSRFAVCDIKLGRKWAAVTEGIRNAAAA